MLERDIEKKLVKSVRLLGGRAYKWVSPGNSGVPDRIVILPGGRVIFVELKTDTGSLTPLQKRQIEVLESVGADVMVVKGEDGLHGFIDYCNCIISGDIFQDHKKGGDA